MSATTEAEQEARVSDRIGPPDLILQAAFERAPYLRLAAKIAPRPMIDSPKLDGDYERTGFNWRPILLLIGGVAALMLAFAYL